MTNDTDLPVFPTSAPAICQEPTAMGPLFDDVLGRLADVVDDIEEDQLADPTPCSAYTVGELRQHVLGWLQFFAAALRDPAATATRPDPDTFVLGSGKEARRIVETCSAEIQKAIADNAAAELVTMSAARMAGDGVLAMALGEYIIHAWDLATATGRSYEPPAAALAPAHEFLLGMVAPDYRGPDSGFFDEEVPVAADAPALDQLLGFAGRNPGWTRS